MNPIDPLPPYKIPPSWMVNIRRLFRGYRANTHIGHAVYWEKNPAQKHPHAIKKAKTGNWLTDSRYAQWTNQPHIARKNDLLDIVFKRVNTHPSPKQSDDFQTVENCLALPLVGRTKIP